MSHQAVLAHQKAHDWVLPISVLQYHEMLLAGFIPEQTELIEGLIFRKMTKSSLHEYLAQVLFNFFQQRLDRQHSKTGQYQQMQIFYYNDTVPTQWGSLTMAKLFPS